MQSPIPLSLIALLSATPLWAAPPAKTAKPPVKKPVSPLVQKESAPLQVTFPVGHAQDVHTTAISPDGRLVATAGNGETILWEKATGGEIARLPTGGRRIAFSPDGTQLAAAGGSSFVVYDVATRKEAWSGGAGGDIQDIAFSPDGRRFAIATALSSAGIGGLYAWNAKTGDKEFNFLNLNGKTVTTVAWMPGGTQVVAGCMGGDVILCDAVAGQALKTLFNTGMNTVADLEVHPDGRQILVGTPFRNDASEKASSPVRVWDAETGKALRDLPVQWPADYTYETAQCVRWAEGGRAAVASFHAKTPVHVWEANGTLRATYPYPQYFTADFGVSRDGTVAVFPVGNAAALVRLADGSDQRFTGRKLPVNSVAYSENGRWGVLGAENGEARLFETATGRNVRRYVDLVDGQPIYRVSLSAEGTRASAATYDSKAARVVVWETMTGKTLLRWQASDGWVYTTATLSADGKTAVGGNSRGEIRGWDVDSGRELFGPISLGSSDTVHAVSLSPDSRIAAVAAGNGLYLRDPRTGQSLRTLKLPLDGSVYGGFVDWSADSRYVAYVKEAKTYYVFEASSGTLVGWYGGSLGSLAAESPGWMEPKANAVSGFGPGATPANHFQVSGTKDGQYDYNGWHGRSSFVGKRYLRDFDRKTGSIAFYDMTQAQTALHLLPIAGAESNPGGEWLAYDAAGRFTGSEAAMQTVSVVTGGAGRESSLPIARFFERYYTPNLVTLALGSVGGTATPTPPPVMVSPEEALRSGAPPIVRLVTASTAAKTPTIEVTVEATEQAKGGVKAIRLYQNGRLVGGPSVIRGISVEAVRGATTTKKFTIALANGTNTLRAVAYSHTDVESKPSETTVTFRPETAAKSALYVLSVGINAYKDATMNLTYARPDAESLADLFDSAKGGNAGGGLFARTHITRLLDTEATGAAILSGIAALAQSAKPEDVVLVYLAGHGEMADNGWNFLPTEMRQMALTERVKEFGIPWSRIEAAVGKIQARKVVLVVDACKSGGALTGGVRGVAEEQQALAVMARAQGIHILTASTSQQYAGEVRALGHGILTFALLEGLNGKAVTGGSPAVMVRELMSYVENRVPELSLQYRGEAQYPVPFGRGQNFPVAEKP